MSTRRRDQLRLSISYFIIGRMVEDWNTVGVIWFYLVFLHSFAMHISKGFDLL